MIDELPEAPDPATDTPQVFSQKAAAMVLAQRALPAQINAAMAQLNAFASGGAYSFLYTFDSGTADADPGTGRLRLGSSVQNAATVMRIDQQIVGGASIATLLDAIGSGTSVLKGAIRIVKVSDPSSWMLFDIMAVNSASGYRNLTVAYRASSTVSPFANNDSIMIFLDRAGDVGNGAEVLIGSADITEATALINFLNVSPAIYDSLRIEMVGVTFSALGATQVRLGNAGAVSSALTYTSTTNPGGTTTSASNSQWSVPNTTAASAFPLTASIDLLNLQGSAPKVIRASGVYRYDASGVPTYVSMSEQGAYTSSHVVSGFQLSRSAGTFTGGKIRVYGRRT